MRKLIIAALLVAFMTTLCGCARVDGATSGGRFGVNKHFNNIDVITDKETGVQYIMAMTSYGAGLTVLVDEDGKPMIAGGES